MGASTSTATPAVTGRASGLAGWIGMVMLQGSTLPTLYDALTGVAYLPPLSLTALTWAGLSLYLWNAIAQRNVLYMVGNTIGLTLNSIVMGLILIS
jgi:hypothetical protein